jgi:D-alanyl-D-alanine carboxypeptidase
MATDHPQTRSRVDMRLSPPHRTSLAALGLLLATLVSPARNPIGAQITQQAPPTLPPGRAGDAVRAYLTAMDAADSAAIKAWITRYDPEGDLVVRTNRQLGLARRTGGFVIDGIVRGDDSNVEAILRERKSRVPVRFELALNANGIAESFGLEPLTVHADSPPAAPQQGNATPVMARVTLVRRLGALVDSLARAGQFAGVVSLTQRGATVFERAYGEADRVAHTPNTLETAFNLGSINKLFTTIAVRQLAASGKLALDSTLARAWPDYPNRDVASRVTIRQILQHSSGIAGNIFEVPGLSAGQIRHNRQVLAAIVNAPLAFAPGAREQYSNAGYVVLGGLIERVSGEDYYAYVQRHIFAPAGMTRSAHFTNDSLPPRTAIGYTRGGPGAPSTAALSANGNILPGRGTSAGGGYTTIGDLKRFLAALRKGAIVDGPPAGIGIAGGSPGVNAVLEGDMTGEYDLIVLSNFDPPSAERIAQRVREWLGVRD